ncbi:unnamed protein product [Paramecium pentaurelia]|uniref:Uncharacterized protein n=1 Tax=Paramecium pentaurelia TaxID=43138 RepID=A0A8S1T0Z0_9CILI|nr:unnamed protein product [Paramecium pentaurelia]
MLFTYGFYNVENQIPFNDKGGQLKLSNHSSLIDWIYFLSQSSPNFATFVESGDEIRYSILTINQVIKTLFSIIITQKELGCQTNQLGFNQLGLLSPPRQMISELQKLEQPINIYVLTYPDKSFFTPIIIIQKFLTKNSQIISNICQHQYKMPQLKGLLKTHQQFL